MRQEATPPRYTFTDRSVARPLLTRWWFRPLFRFVPRRLAANLVTLLSFATLWVGLAAARSDLLQPAALALVLLACHLIYVAGDHLDGMQAVASATTSPLGDFLDHYCDLWAGSILIFSYWLLLGDATVSLLYTVQALLILSFAVTYVEREEQRTLHFTALGALEANLVFVVFLLSWTSGVAREWWRAPAWVGLPRYWLPVMIGVAIALGVMLVIVRRMRHLPWTLVVFAASVILLAALVTTYDLPPTSGWLTMALLGGGYIARVMRGYLISGHRTAPDLIATALIGVLVLWSALARPRADLVLTAVFYLDVALALSMTHSLARILGSLRLHWVWLNR